MPNEPGNNYQQKDTCYNPQMWSFCTCTNEANNIFMMHLSACKNVKSENFQFWWKVRGKLEKPKHNFKAGDFVACSINNDW